MTAANGFLSFGLVAALLVETMRNIRIGQRDELKLTRDLRFRSVSCTVRVVGR